MTRASAAIRPVPTLSRVRGTVGIYLVTACSSIVVALFVVAGSQIGLLLRLTLALVIAFLLITLSLARPSAGVLATFVYLIFLAFIRRVLISAAGWNSFDPLLLVGYLVAIVLIVKLVVLERRHLAPDLLSKLILLLLAVTVVQVANPTGAGIKANIVGLLYMAAPLLWFFVGRGFVDDELSDRILGMVILLGLVIAAYGLYQTQVGDPPWDVNWLNTTGGYSSLNVGDTIRAFGTFSSSAEYTLFVGTAVAAAFAFFLRGRPVALLAIPLLAIALFLGSGRSSLITAFLAIVVMLALRPRKPLIALLVTVVAVGGAYGGLKVFGSDLSSTAAGSSSSLVSHQLGGISDPLNPNSSTLLTHISLVVTGFKTGFTHPEGEGPGETNQAAGLNSQQSSTQATQATEVDISNAFVSLGVVGGVLYLVIVLMILWKAASSYFRGRDAALPVIGLLVVGAGQWLIGGAYALSPLTWLMVGSIAAGSAGALRRSAEPPTDPNQPTRRNPFAPVLGGRPRRLWHPPRAGDTPPPLAAFAATGPAGSLLTPDATVGRTWQARRRAERHLPALKLAALGPAKRRVRLRLGIATIAIVVIALGVAVAVASPGSHKAPVRIASIRPAQVLTETAPAKPIHRATSRPKHHLPAAVRHARSRHIEHPATTVVAQAPVAPPTSSVPAAASASNNAAPTQNVSSGADGSASASSSTVATQPQTTAPTHHQSKPTQTGIGTVSGGG